MLVSIACLTYNHEKFISEALDSFLAQKTNFSIEIVVYDGGSQDGNRKVIENYQKKYSEIIKPIFPEKDPGIARSFYNLIKSCKGKYIALCEGDDYWTYANKLQEQVELLEKENTYSLCFTLIDIVNEEGKIINKNSGIKTDLTHLDILSGGIPQMPTVVFKRTSLPETFPKEFFSASYLDHFLYALVTLAGAAKFINKSTAVYRQHSLGSYSAVTIEEKIQKTIENLHLMKLVFISEKEKSAITKGISFHYQRLLFTLYTEKDWFNFRSWFKKILVFDLKNNQLTVLKAMNSILRRSIRNLYKNI